MNRTRIVAATTLTAILASVAGIALAREPAQERQPAPAQARDTASVQTPLDLLVPYIGGEWQCTGKWSSGEPLVAREVFTWGIGKKFINVKTYVTGPEGEYQRYEAMYGVKDGKLMSWSFTFDGKAETAEWKVEGKKWSASNAQKTPDGASMIVHQSVELVEPNKFRWIVEIERDGQRTPLFDGFWVRESAPAAAADQGHAAAQG